MKDVNIGAKVKNLRELNLLKQNEFGEKLGFKKSTVCGWENGDSTPDIKTLLRICKVYDVDITYFFPSEKDYSEWILLANYAQNKNISTKKIMELIEFLHKTDS